MSKNEDAVIVHGVKITEDLTKILKEFEESDLDAQKNLLAKNCLFIAGLSDPEIMPIDKEFFLVCNRVYELLCAIVITD